METEGRLKFERESWRKLYIAESAEHRLLSVFARGLRDYLLRLAGEDGTILAKTTTPKSDLHRLLGAQKAEVKLVNDAFDALVGVGYLSIDGGRLWITRFTEAQSARSPGAARQAAFKANKRKREASSSEACVTLPSASAVTPEVTLPGDALETLQIDETRRDETRTPNPAAAVAAQTSLADRARKVLENPHDGQFSQPSKWPEVLEVCESWSFGMVVRLRDFVNSDSDLRAILEAFRDGYSVDDCLAAGRAARSSEYFAGLKSKGPASFTAAVLRRLLAGPAVAGAPKMELPPGLKFGAEGL